MVTGPTATIKKSLPNGITANTNGLSKAHNQAIAINLSTSDGISPALLSATNAAMPLNLNINSIHQPTITNGMNGKTHNGPNGLRGSNINDGLVIAKEQSKNKNESLSAEPPTKVIKLINSNGITLASVEKDSKLLQSGQLTLSQVVVSQIPLTTTQTLRVIGQAPNGVATIELNNSNGMLLRKPRTNKKNQKN